MALRGARRDLMRRHEAPLDPVGAPVTDPSGGVAVAMSVRQALRQLSPRQRAAVVLRYYADLRLEEIAKAMGCKTGTVKATLHAAREALQVTLEEGDDDEP